MSDFSASLMVLLFAFLAIFISALILLLNRLVGPKRKGRHPDIPFECGINPTSHMGTFSINYYLVACAFLVFELEAAILLPWADSFWSLGYSGVTSAVSFIVILLLGLVYLLGKGGLSAG